MTGRIADTITEGRSFDSCPSPSCCGVTGYLQRPGGSTWIERRLPLRIGAAPSFWRIEAAMFLRPDLRMEMLPSPACHGSAPINLFHSAHEGQRPFPKSSIRFPSLPKCWHPSISCRIRSEALPLSAPVPSRFFCQHTGKSPSLHVTSHVAQILQLRQPC